MHSAAWVSTSLLLGSGSGLLARVTPIKRPRVRVPLRVNRTPRASLQSSVDPVDQPLGPAVGNRFAISRWGEGIRGDVRRRGKVYLSDWLDGVTPKAIPTILFLYCACLAPVVAFGGITATLTGGTMGVVEFLLASGGVGMLYSVGSGQPLTFLAPTGLTLAFTTALYSFCEVSSIPFLATYAWVGVWTSIILLVMAIANTSDLIKHCTRFTDDIFNSLIATNFLYEATRSLGKLFFVLSPDKTHAFTALSLAFGTVFTGRSLSGLRSSRFLWRKARTVLSDFGPLLAVTLMSAIAAIPAVAKVGLSKLSIPATFSLANSRPLFIPLLATPLSIRLIAIVPALLLTCLFFLDQNISVRVVNARGRKLRKGPAYHLDMMMLAICTFACSICGMPLMCAGTVQSLAHVQALSNVETVNGTERVVSVVENRLTAFLIHALIFSSLLLLPIVSRIPMAVISGLFLFLGLNMMNNNDFLARIPYMFMDPTKYPQDAPMNKVPAFQVHVFTILQLACLGMLWGLKLNKRTSMFFPAVIGALMFIRSRIAPKIFSPNALAVLDSDVAGSSEDDVPSVQVSEKDKLASA